MQLIVLLVYVGIRSNQGYSASALANAPPDSPLLYQPARRYEAWRFLSYMLVHHGSVGFCWLIYYLHVYA